MPSAAIVGAGLSGLTAGYRLQQAGWQVEVFEALDRPGGRVQTVRKDGFAVDTGATALGSTYHSYLALAEELGVGIRPTAPYVGIRRGGVTHLLNMDRRLSDGLRTPLLSWGAKFRVARLAADVAVAKIRGRLDYADLSKAAPLDTETAHSYASRVLGAELDSYLCDPIVRTMLIADGDKISKVELFSGLANIFSAQLLTAVGGQAAMVDALAGRLNVHLNTPVIEVRRGGRRSVRLSFVDSVSDFDACVVTCPLPEASAICSDDREVLSAASSDLAYTQCVSVAIGTTRKPDCPAFLVMLPPVEDRDIALMFLDHNKSADRVPEGRGLISCLWEAGASRRVIDDTDESLVSRTLDSLFTVFPELRGTVCFTHVTRWNRALPLTGVGTYRRIGSLNAALDRSSPVQYAADFLSAAGQNTAVEFGSRAAHRLIDLAVKSA